MKRVLTVMVLLGLAVLITTASFGSVVPAAALGALSPAMNVYESALLSCDNLRTLAVGASAEQSAAWRSAGAEWIKFSVRQGGRYRLQVNHAAGLRLALHDRCDASGPAVDLRDGQLEFTATRDQDLYLMVVHDGISSTGLSGYEATLVAADPHRPILAAVDSIPQDAQRRAKEFLEELRGSGLAPEWLEARISSQARILYRPDIVGPAYYEFTVEKPVAGGWEPAGFVQLSSGEHDYVLTQWNATGMSPTQELQEIAPLGVQLTAFYKLNTLSYAAEYEQLTAIGIAAVADDVYNLGELPSHLTGLEGILEEPAELVTEGVDSEGNTEYEGPTELPLIEETPWDSWAALKAGYAENYAPLLASLKQRASEGWQLEKNLAQYGETLVKGDVRTVYGLPAQTLSSIDVTGEGATPEYLGQERLSDNGNLTGVRLTVLDEPADPETLLPFEVVLQYSSGTTETVKYAIANQDALNFHEVFLPLTTKSSTSSATDVSVAGSVEPAGWGPWHYYWADANAGTIRYNQIPAGSSPNTSGCWSGCGATAWAMEFGWVDQRAAEGHWRWANHWGLYRVNGGLGSNAVAPNPMDTGVRNMTWEIRGYLGTYCSDGGGATRFTRMIDAYRYVQPRATAGWRMRTRYDPTGLCWFGACNGARDLARDQIVNYRAPAIIGANNHYPMAYGYAWQKKTSCWWFICSTSYNRWFYVNQGWGGSGNGWVDWDDVAFAGVYRPY